MSGVPGDPTQATGDEPIDNAQIDVWQSDEDVFYKEALTDDHAHLT